MSRGGWLHLCESPQGSVSYDVIFGRCSWLCLKWNLCWARVISVRRYVMSVGQGLKIDIYLVSARQRAKTRLLFVSWSLRSPIPITFLSLISPSIVIITKRSLLCISIVIIKYYWDVKCKLFAAISQDVPEDIHHVQRPQPSWPDDLVSTEQTPSRTFKKRPSDRPGVVKQSETESWCSPVGIYCMCAAIETLTGFSRYSSILTQCSVEKGTNSNLVGFFCKLNALS